MEFEHVLTHRRMVRNYTEEPVDLDDADHVARAALSGPTAGFSQGIAVVVITDQHVRDEIAEIAGEAEYVEAGFHPWISRAPVHLVIAVSERLYRDRYSEPDKLGKDGKPIEWPVPYWWVDAGAALMAALLAAVDRGLAAGFLGVHSLPDLANLLDVPDHYSPIGVVTLGHPAPDRRSSSLDRGRRDLGETLHWNGW